MHSMLFNYGFFCIIAPVLTTVLIFLYIYRRIVEIILKYRLKDRFVGLLEGTDCIWAIEEPSALSVINVLVVLEKDQRRLNANVLESFRNLIKERLIGSNFEKVLYRRRKKYGYYFWERTGEIDLRERIRWLEHDQTRCDGYCDDIYGESLKRVLEEKCNQPLPRNHSTSWEILISNNCSCISHQNVRLMEEGRSILDHGRMNKIKIPVLFRIHHALGDGTALLKLFLETIADKPNEVSTIPEVNCSLERQRNDCKRTELDLPVFANCVKNFHVDEQLCYSNNVISVCMPFADLQTLRILMTGLRNYLNGKMKYFEHVTFDEFKNEMQTFLHDWWSILKEYFTKVIYEKVQTLTKYLILFILMPSYLMDQAIRSMDKKLVNVLRNLSS